VRGPARNGVERQPRVGVEDVALAYADRVDGSRRGECITLALSQGLGVGMGWQWIWLDGKPVDGPWRR